MIKHRRNEKELKDDFQKVVGEMAETKPRENASKFFKHKAYECDGAKRMIKAQSEQMEAEE